MANLRQAKTDTELRSMTISNVKKAYSILAEELIKKMIEQQKDMKIPTSLIPYCPHCGKFKSIKADNFYSSNETVDGIEHFACRECIINMCTDRDKNGNRIDNKAKTIDTFRRLNWYFNEDDYEAQLVKVKEGVKEKLRSTAAQQLIVIVQSLPQYKSMTFAQSKFNDSSDDIPAYKRKPRKEIVKLFGSGLSNEDYLYLQDQYDDWCERTQVDSKSQQTYIVRICFKLFGKHRNQVKIQQSLMNL